MSSNDDQKGRKLKILALHSMHASAAILKAQVAQSGISEAIEDLVELDFIDAPDTATKEEVTADISSRYGGPYRRWWNPTGWPLFDPDKPADAEGVEAAVSSLRAAMGKQVYDGVLAFSQGSSAAHIIVSLQQQGKGFQDVPRLRFGIFIAGVYDPEDAERYPYNDSLKAIKAMPSLHIYGEKDPYKKYSEHLAGIFADPLVVRHPKGHIVPKLDTGDIEKLRQFLLEQSQTSACRM